MFKKRKQKVAPMFLTRLPILTGGYCETGLIHDRDPPCRGSDDIDDLAALGLIADAGRHVSKNAVKD
jgi:hypothetical protein